MKPNILFITADQWRGECIGAAGHPIVETPHIDRLASEGLLFRNHFSNAAPCSPARAALYTGLHQMNNRVCRNGTPLDNRFDNVARAARRAGYEPTLFGYTDTAPDPRIHDPNDPQLTTHEGVLPGFSVRQLLPEDDRPWLSWLEGRGGNVSSTESIHRPADPTAPEVSNAPPLYGAEETQTAFLTEAFVNWLSERDADRPWFAHISFLRPHPPFIVPEPFNALYDAQSDHDFARQETMAAEAATHPFLAYLIDRQKKADFIAGAEGCASDWSDAQQRIIRSVYWGMISEVDAQLGNIWRELEAAGAWDDTMIVLTSDHAEMMGDHWLFGKGGFFDGGYHIPLIVRMPRARAAAGTVVDAFTEAVDIFPTLLDIMNVEPQAPCDGRSLLPFLRGDAATEWRQAVFWEFDFRDIENRHAEAHFGLSSRLCNLAVLRDAHYKYVHFAGLPPLLFDLANDPYETQNLAADPAHRDTRLRYAEALLCHRACHLDQTLASVTLTEDGVVGIPL